MDIEEFYKQQYKDRQLVEFVDDSKLEKKPLAARLGIAILEKDNVITVPLYGLNRLWVLFSKKHRSQMLTQLDEIKWYQNFKNRMLTRLNDAEVQQKYMKRGVVINLIGVSYAEHFKLPPGHPRDHTIYVAHPLLPQYNPFADFHHFVFENKFNELVTLLTHLGARTIEVSHVIGWGYKFASHLSVNLGAPPEAKSSSHRDVEQKLLYKSVLPGHEPSLPENLHWYYSEQGWQQIADQRLHHGLQQFSLDHEYKDDFGINTELGGKLQKAGFGLGGNFEGHASTVWHLSGEF